MLTLLPIDFKTASAFIREHHRHHIPTVGWKFGVRAVNNAGETVGVVVVGRPVSRRNDNGLTLEVTRMCSDGSRNVCSFLYGAARRASKAMGYRRLITYTMAEESGASLHGAGWKVIGQTKGASWSVPTRPRTDKHPLGQRTVWEVQL